jgi:hypothetical protein
VAGESAIYERFKPLINRYRGGLPGGMAAAIIAHESGGNPDARGDASLQEAGLLQVTSAFPISVGVDPSVRLTIEGNIWLGLLEYNLRAVQMMPYAALGSADSWKLARLGFAVGSGGAARLIDAATNHNPRAFAGHVFDQIRSWANQTGAMALSSGQPASKVLARINAVQDQWDIGQRISGSYGPPERIPAPAGLTYRIPLSAAPFLASPLTGTLVAVSLLGTLGLLLYLRSRKADHVPSEPAPAA